MRLLVLGGNQFLSREAATQALARGWEVACACRGDSGAVPSGARHIVWDRSHDAPAGVSAGTWDAVLDVTGLPSHARRALDALQQVHWVYVSTISVYTDNQSALMQPIAEPIVDDLDLSTSPHGYGGMKVACEQAIQGGAASCAIVRPGLIVGPNDPSGRFAYWPQRLSRGGPVLAPGRPSDRVQVIDVRDLASWLLDLAEQQATGTFDAVGEIMSFEDMLLEVGRGVGNGSPDLVWVDAEFLQARGVQAWAGNDSLPLWLPRPEYDGMLSHDPGPAFAAGLRVRAVAETAASCLDSPVLALTVAREVELLQEWHNASSSRRPSPANRDAS